jgi:murein DD-endopeptidase MepM/ murein hydrolase activator NlpD
MTRIGALLAFLACAALAGGGPAAAGSLELTGQATQGGLLLGVTEPQAAVSLDGRSVEVAADGRFVLGFGRDAMPEALLVVRHPDGAREERTLAIAQRSYEVQRIEGLPLAMVTPPPEAIKRIRADQALVDAARARDIAEPLFESGFVWPAIGPISGVYGSQRILNGEPRAPHWGVDIAAPVGSPVLSPADGVVTLAEPDLYLTGGTLIIDHGLSLSSTFLHLSALEVKVGDRVRRGAEVGRVGATGRATGPHLHWGMNWRAARLDPALLVPPMPEVTPSAANVKAKAGQ